MAPVAFSTVLMNFSGIYPEEGFLPVGADVLDCSSLEGTECYCDAGAAAEIRRRMAPYPPEGLHWIDGGDYHYVSLLWMEKIREPFLLALFDHHSDDQPSAFGGDLLSCGNWVAAARERLPLLRGAIWIRDARQVALPAGLPLYLSIDKDVLSPDYARTNWDQGGMTLPQLEWMIHRLASRHRILGIDVCGGLSRPKGACGKDVEINRRTDEELQAFFVTLQTI